jgi:hypothetical protein
MSTNFIVKPYFLNFIPDRRVEFYKRMKELGQVSSLSFKISHPEQGIHFSLESAERLKD